MSKQDADLNEFKENLYTALPAKVISFDGELASVQPTIDKSLANGEMLQAPIIHDVPMCLMLSAGNSARVTIPIQSGDDVLLIFSQRSTENWKMGIDGNQNMTRKHDISDAFAIPVLRPTKISVDTTNIIINNGGSTITVAPNGSVDIVANVTITGNLLVNGDIKSTQEINSKNISLESHTHSGVESGNKRTGGPA